MRRSLSGAGWWPSISDSGLPQAGWGLSGACRTLPEAEAEAEAWWGVSEAGWRLWQTGLRGEQ